MCAPVTCIAHSRGRGGARSGPGGHRRGRGTVARGSRRCARVPLGRTGDPRHRGRTAATRPARHGSAAAVRPALVGRAAPDLRTGADGRSGSAHRARHERRRDVADRAGRALRRRCRHRPHLAVQPPPQGAATADRAGVPSVGQPAGRSMRPCGPGHLHPAVRRGRLRPAPRVHRPGDPAHEPGLGHPPDDRDRARRRGAVPVRRAARPPLDRRRLRTARRTGGRRARSRWPEGRPAPPHEDRSRPGPPARSTRGSGGWCSRRSASAACARCS